jgi:hypothetical protein
MTAQRSPKGTPAACQPKRPESAHVPHVDTHSPAEPQTDQVVTDHIVIVPVRVLGRAPPSSQSSSASSESASSIACFMRSMSQSRPGAYKVKPASERSANTTEILHVCIYECYVRYGALLTPREVFWSRPRATSWFWREDHVRKCRNSTGPEYPAYILLEWICPLSFRPS